MSDTARPPEIEVFTQQHCAACRQVEALLTERGLSFTRRRVDQEPSALQQLLDHGYLSTPVTRIGDQWIAGFRRKAIERALLAAS